MPGSRRAWARSSTVGDAFGSGSATERERIQVEMVSANPTGPFRSLASARNGAYGDSVARLLGFAGHEVEREYYFNDAGAQMELFHASVDAVRRGEEPPEDGYRGEYIAELAKLPGDPALAMVERIDIVFAKRNGTPTPVWIRTGLTDLDYSEVVVRPAAGRFGATSCRARA